MASSYDLAPPAKRPCPVGREQLVERLSLEGVSVRNNVRLATLLETANAHGLLALAPEPQVGAMYAQCANIRRHHVICNRH